MKFIRIDNPPLSFAPSNLTIEKQENGWHYKIYAGGDEIALLIYRNGYGFSNNSIITLTEFDKAFIIEHASKL